MFNKLRAVAYPFQSARNSTLSSNGVGRNRVGENGWGLKDAGGIKIGTNRPNLKEKVTANLFRPTTLTYRVVWCRQHNGRLHQTPSSSMRRVARQRRWGKTTTPVKIPLPTHNNATKNHNIYMQLWGKKQP